MFCQTNTTSFDKIWGSTPLGIRRGLRRSQIYKLRPRRTQFRFIQSGGELGCSFNLFDYSSLRWNPNKRIQFIYCIYRYSSSSSIFSDSFSISFPFRRKPDNLVRTLRSDKNFGSFPPISFNFHSRFQI